MQFNLDEIMSQNQARSSHIKNSSRNDNIKSREMLIGATTNFICCSWKCKLL